ncbi:MAG TPA: hypothetical protein P5318_05605 [Candidatus Hydrogenedentes bacterium]|nr:hypothetical protein [Candidatus Hydrogenedentota bacterium]HPC15160.1 hypothetical protein [Candidatus Hydrogenedentota bacterium]HRT19585.1 hypothetical protein [Candidatus Hydrogenedentota bacterium]HRT64159.1 hypothetical protein [Candidatus Hydrogenedentota bacterium]
MTLLREVVETFIRLVKAEIAPNAVLVHPDDVFEAPIKYISAQATSSARSLRCHFASGKGSYGSIPRACGTDSASSPIRVFTVLGL